MHHRYGRHGPHAWRRWRERRYARPSLLPVPVESSPVESPPVAPTTIFRIFVPATEERIIFIIMQNIINPEDEDEFVESRSDFSLVPLPQNTDEIRRISESPMEKRARNQARKDAKEIKGLTDDGNFVRVHWDKVDRETDRFAEDAIDTIYPGKETPDEHKCDRLIEEYQEAYRQSLKERLKRLCDDGASVDYFDTGLEARLRKLAIADRENAPQRRPYHKRDLAVIRVLFLLDVSLDIADDHLADIHTWADKYESYYNNPREEVNWPECRESFPAR